MNIVFLVETIDRMGGIQRSLSIRANYLVEKYNYKITIVCTEKQTGIPVYELHDSIKVICLDKLVSKKTLIGRVHLRYKQSKFILNTLNPDVIISVKYTLHNLFFRLLKKNKPKLISELRETKRLYNANRNKSIKTRINAAIRDYIFKNQDALIVLTEADKKEWGYENIKVIPNPHTLFTTKKSDLKSKQVLAIGRLTKIKGFDVLLKVWKIVYNHYPDWKLKICGEGEEYSFLKGKIEKYGLQSSVILTNKFQKVEPLFLESSIFVLSSQYEAFGNVLVEAKLFGVPIVAFDAPNGPKEIVKEGEDGFLVELNNIEKMAEKIIFLIQNPDKREEMGKKAIVNSKIYDVDNILDMYNKMLLEL